MATLDAIADALRDISLTAAGIRTDVRSGIADTLRDISFALAGLRVDVRSAGAPGGGGPGGPPPNPNPAPPGGGGPFEAFTTGAAKVGAILYAAERAMVSFGNSVAAFVGKARPDVVQRWTLATDDLMAVIGRAVAPILERTTALVRKLADAFASLSPQAQQLVAGLAGGAGLGAVLGAASLAVKALMASLGPIPLIVGALAGAFAGVASTMASGRELAAAFGSVLTVLGSVVETVARVVVPVVAGVLVPVLGVIAEVLGRAAAAFAEVAGVVGGALQAAVSVAVATVKTLAVVVGAVLAPAIELVMPLVNAVAGFFQRVAQVVRDFLEFLGFAADEYKVEDNKSVGASVRRASIGGLQEFASRSYASALQGGGQDVSRAQLGELKGMRKSLDDLPGRLAEKLRSGAASGVLGGTGEEGRRGRSIVGHAAAGAVVGSVVPVVGTAAGAAVGATIGIMRELFG